MKNKGPTWLYVALTCSHLLCCRITEVLRLKAKDFGFEHKVVAISSLKGQAAITKTMSCAAFSTFNRFKDEGISVQRVRGIGCRGRMNVGDKWEWPLEQDGLLFPADRSDSKTAERNKDTVSKAIARSRKSFNAPAGCPVLKVAQIRSHSGRHRAINDMKQHEVNKEVGKTFALWMTRFGRTTAASLHPRQERPWLEITIFRSSGRKCTPQFDCPG